MWRVLWTSGFWVDVGVFGFGGRRALVGGFLGDIVLFVLTSDFSADASFAREASVAADLG